MTINRIQTERIQEPAVCPVCDTIFNGHAVTIDTEPALYCSHRCLSVALDRREWHVIINDADVWNPLYSCYESTT